ncbi:MAG: cytidine deaminase [Methylobacter sp.]|nr:MAG: cytidine deaminase [Methylobacter sp.]PPD04920.1 MAG: cytidine deaminase [Methylobacter sp.]PPD18410.1 MAG: cytidine deaminase [Methylobacter sp.]PPD32543.1 MAG: cytidine deaminase [Methylomonas sp.]
MPENIPLELIKAAIEVARHAYAPYSHFAVGAAAVTTDGSLYTGANMENASYGLTVCAEIGALQAACSAGKLADIVKIAVVGSPQSENFTTQSQLITPCGRCRQLILESAKLGQRDIEIWCASPNMTSIALHHSSTLLPHSFSADDLAIADKTWLDSQR